ncbi:glycosyltransferase family 2 protein [Halomonas smyrnensis]|uniref:glycosyltransferase family 2 protein n=1 Tax=Halomonas smyrnensis TaxID=720605 RepID=UPI000A005F1C|nr:glycosyltransferase [Halomonas smyrnensis]
MTIQQRPLVSIIIPVYNVEAYIDECLNSICGQSYDRLEVIIVEDCSTDGSLTNLKPHLSDSRVRLIQHDCNAGLSAARNTGIEAACGDFVLFVDSDDVIDLKLVEACLVHASANGSDVVVFDFSAFNDGEELPEVGARASSASARELKRTEYLTLPHFAWLKFIRSDLLRDQRLRFPVGYYYEDWPFHWELGFSAMSITMLEGEWYGYRQREMSITASVGCKLLDQFKVQEKVLDIVRARGDHAEATILFTKASEGFWAVLLSIDMGLLPEALNNAKRLQNEIRYVGLQFPRGAHDRAKVSSISIHESFAFPCVKLLKVIGRVVRS